MTAAMKLLGAKGSSWSPSALPGVVAWWDASAASTFTYSSGDLVSTWSSRVGSLTLTQSTTSKQATRSGSSVVFGSDDSYATVASVDLSASNAVSLWAVFSAPSGGDRILAELSPNFNNVLTAFLLLRTASNVVQLSRRLPSTQYSTWNTTGTVTTTPKAFVGALNAVGAGGAARGWVNGSAAGTFTGNTATNSSFGNHTLFVGARNNSSLFLGGTFHELGFCSVAIGSTDRVKLETYLSAKWGLGF